MARNKNSKGGGKGPVLSKKQAQGSRGERLRKREDERETRRAKKRRKLGKKPLKTDRSGGHEGRVKKDASKRRLELARLTRLVSKQEDLLRDYRPPEHVAPLDPELKRKVTFAGGAHSIGLVVSGYSPALPLKLQTSVTEILARICANMLKPTQKKGQNMVTLHERAAMRRRRDFYDLDTSHWKLTGAARPADSLPGAGGTELVDERDEWEAGVDLFEKFGRGSQSSGDDDDARKEGKEEGGFYDGPEACREYLDLNHQLAQALHHENSESKAKEALLRYTRCMELDPLDHVMARRGLVRLLMDDGAADEARAIIERFPDDRGCEMAWSLAAIEFVAWSVLEEEGAGEKVAAAALEVAHKANPFLAWNIAHREIFDEVVEHADEVIDPSPGSVEEAFWYMLREGGLWASLEGSSEWVANFLLENEILPPSVPGDDVADDQDKVESNNGKDGNGGKKRSRDDDAGEGTIVGATISSTVVPQDNHGSSNSNAEMFANMFETAVGMAAEMVEQQLGIADENREREDESERVLSDSGHDEDRQGDGSEDDDDDEHSDAETF